MAAGDNRETLAVHLMQFGHTLDDVYVEDAIAFASQTMFTERDNATTE